MNRMPRIFLILSFVVFPLVGFASVQQPSPAKTLAELARDADVIEVEFYSKSGKDVLRFSDSVWTERLAGSLESATYSPRSHCLCISFPEVRLYQKKKLILTLSVHHNEKLRAYSDSVSGDFHVGEETGSFISKLANERKD